MLFSDTLQLYFIHKFGLTVLLATRWQKRSMTLNPKLGLCIYTICLMLIQKNSFNSKCVDGNWTDKIHKCELVQCSNITKYFKNPISITYPNSGNFIKSEYKLSCQNDDTLKIGEQFLFDTELIKIKCLWDPRMHGKR